MKVLFFSNIVPDKMGSYEIFCSRLGEALRKAGDSLVVVAGGKPIEPVCDEWKKSGISLSWIDGWTDSKGIEHQWRFVLPAWRKIKEEKPDAVVVNFGNEVPAVVCCVLTKLLCRNKTIWIWQQHQQIKDPGIIASYFSKIRLLSVFYDKLIAVYDGGRTSLLKRAIPDSKIEVFYNAIDDHVDGATGTSIRKELGLPDNSMLLTYVGMLIHRKRVDFLINAFSSALKTPELINQKDIYLLIIGDGPLKEKLVSDAKGSGLAERIKFAGLRNDARRILKQSSIYIHAALAETCTYTITESMCAGIPAVVTDAGAAREQIKDSETGFVLEQDDVKGFADKIVYLVNDPDVMDRMGIAARRRWSEKYRLENIVEQYAAFMKRRMKFDG